jgi:DnaJ-class molecular chaperone
MTEGFVMAFVDCYAVLGVPRDANLSQVRRAFRALCHQLDPDHHEQPSAAAIFRDASEAFDTLCHAGARADHDRELARRDVAGEPEPGRPYLSAPRDLFDDFEDYRPSRETLLRAFVDNVIDRLPKSRSARPIYLDVALEKRPADTTGVVPLRVPAPVVCNTCDGTGRTGLFTCDCCGGEGVTWATWRVDVPVPADAMMFGTSIPVSLAPIGVKTLFLDVIVRSSAAD